MDRRRSLADIAVFVATVVSVLLVDRAAKVFFTTVLRPGESLPVIPKIVHFTLVHNTGIAFGLFRDNGAVYFVVPVIAVALLVYNIHYYRKFGDLDRLYIVAFSLILGGAIGNFIDRVLFGHVVDFIDLRVWPVFNIADSAITVGAAIIFFKCFPLTRR